MSALAQQQQPSQQVQQPSQQQGAQQGPVPEAASFGSGNAVEFQGAYGNEAVAGMAGVEGAGVEGAGVEEGSSAQSERECSGGELAERDPALASRVDAARAKGEAAYAGAGAWASSVPPEHTSYVNERVFGLGALLDYLHDATSDANAALSEGDEAAFSDARHALMELTSKVDVATSIVDACEQFYQASELQMTTQQLAEVHETLMNMDRLHEAVGEYSPALGRADNAQLALMDGMSDFVEAGLQAQLMNGAAALNTLRGVMEPALGPQSLVGKLLGALGAETLLRASMEPSARTPNRRP